MENYLAITVRTRKNRAVIEGSAGLDQSNEKSSTCTWSPRKPNSETNIAIEEIPTI